MLNYQEWISDFKWCIENDFQVYVKPVASKQFKIAVRKGGISTNGKDMHYCKIKEITLRSTETLGPQIYQNQKQAFKSLPKAYKYLRNVYG